MSLDPSSRSRLTGPGFVLPLAAVFLAVAYLWGVVIPAAELNAPRGFGPFRYWDLETYFLPKFVFGSQEFWRGVWPAWNPYEFGGIPFLATIQPAPVYPPKILFFGLWDPATALRVFLVLHFVLMGGLFAWFLRESGIGALGLVVGTLFWTFHFEVLLSNSHPIRIATLGWVPLIFLLGQSLARSVDLVRFAVLALVVALQITAGYPEFVMDTGLVLALHVTVLYLNGDSVRPPWQSVPLLAGAFLLGGLVAGTQVLPLLELTRFSGRFDFAGDQAARAGLIYVSFLTIGFPALLGFAFAGLDRRRASPILGAVVCLVMSFGAWRLIRLLPGFSAVRLPFAWMSLLPFYLAWLSAAGADRFDQAAAGRALNGLARWGLALASLGWAGLCMIRWVVPGWGSELGWLHPFVPAGAGTAAGSLLVSGAGFVGGLALAAYAVGPARLRSARPLAFAGVGLVVLGQLSAYPYGVTPLRLGPPEAPLRSANLIPAETLRQGRVLSVHDPRGGFQMLDRVEGLFGREGSLPPPRFTALEHALGVVVQERKIRWEEVVDRRGLLETLDVRYVVAPRALTQALGRTGYRATGRGRGKTAVFENADRPGRAWAVYAVEVVDTEEAAFARVLESDFDPRVQVLLEQAPVGSYPRVADRPPTPAQVRNPSPSVTEVEVDMAAPGVLVLADACYPGWSATVDGKAAPILCANYLVRGVEVPAGKHRVRFEYAPASVTQGLAASAIGVVAVLVLVVLGVRQRRRNRLAPRSGAVETLHSRS